MSKWLDQMIWEWRLYFVTWVYYILLRGDGPRDMIFDSPLVGLDLLPLNPADNREFFGLPYGDVIRWFDETHNLLPADIQPPAERERDDTRLGIDSPT